MSRRNQYRLSTDEARSNTDDIVRRMRARAVHPGLTCQEYQERRNHELWNAIGCGVMVLLMMALWIGWVVYP